MLPIAQPGPPARDGACVAAASARGECAGGRWRADRLGEWASAADNKSDRAACCRSASRQLHKEVANAQPLPRYSARIKQDERRPDSGGHDQPCVGYATIADGRL